MEFLDGVAAHWVWLIVGSAFLIIELLTGTTFLLWPGFGAILFAGVVYAAGPLSLGAQIASYAAMSVALAVVGRTYLKIRPDQRPSERPELNDRAAQLIGRRVVAAETFTAGSGAVTVGDTRYRARVETPAGDGADEIRAGAVLEIRAVDGALLVVAPV